MMETLNNAPRKFTLLAAVFAMTALAIALLAVSYTTGPAQAQNVGNTYPDPQPCGPGAGTAFQPEPHEVTTGHFALFDGYWEWTNPNPNKGIMHTNECPPKMVAGGRGGPSRDVSNIDLGEAIMHVKNVRQVEVVATNAEANDAKLSLEEYPDVRAALGLIGPNGEKLPVPAGTKVWWLRLDDPDTKDNPDTPEDENIDETSDLSIGFSAALFDRKYWLTGSDGDRNIPMRYMLESVRYRNIEPGDTPHFFAYEAPLEDNGTQGEAVWDSFNLDVEGHDMTLDPGEYRPLQWIFITPGTYVLSAHLQGFVRYEKPDGAGEDWKRISPEEDETSEVRDYVFQVGDKLDETEPPMFGVNRSVHEDAGAGAHVGEPIEVFNAEVPNLSYQLTGKGHRKFSVTSRTHPRAAQIVVAANAKLDYDSKSSYDLVLRVSDGKDHEGNDDNSIDHSIAVKIDVIQQPHAYLIASNHTPAVGESVTFRVHVWDMPDGITSVTDNKLSYIVWEAKSGGGVTSAIFPAIAPNSFEGTTTVSQNAAGTYKYTPTATYTLNGATHRVHGDPVTITWRNP